jgi:hypothetical protein
LVDPYKSSYLSWFDPHHANMLSEIFPRFMYLLNDPLWKDPIGTVIHLFIECNKQAGALNGSIVLAQSALELLSWILMVQQKQSLSGEGFIKLPASDQLCLLLTHLGIPLDVNKSLIKASELSKEFDKNGPELFTATRNSIIHPYHKHKEKYSTIILEMWKLGLWYIELSLLSLCKYDGNYFNRLSEKRITGQVEPVPWKK